MKADQGTFLQHASDFGMTPEVARKLQYEVDRLNAEFADINKASPGAGFPEHIEIRIRPTNPDSLPWLQQGYAGKPEPIKAKTINDTDVKGGWADAADKGLVGYFDPAKTKLPDIPFTENAKGERVYVQPSGMDDAIFKRATQRLDEFHNEQQMMQRLEGDGLLKVDAHGVVRDYGVTRYGLDEHHNPVLRDNTLPLTPKQEGQGIAGDPDVFTALDEHGNIVRPELVQPLIDRVSELMHGALEHWDPLAHATSIEEGAKNLAIKQVIEDAHRGIRTETGEVVGAPKTDALVSFRGRGDQRATSYGNESLLTGPQQLQLAELKQTLRDQITNVENKAAILDDLKARAETSPTRDLQAEIGFAQKQLDGAVGALTSTAGEIAGITGGPVPTSIEELQARIDLHTQLAQEAAAKLAATQEMAKAFDSEIEKEFQAAKAELDAAKAAGEPEATINELQAKVDEISTQAKNIDEVLKGETRSLSNELNTANANHDAWSRELQRQTGGDAPKIDAAGDAPKGEHTGAPGDKMAGGVTRKTPEAPPPPTITPDQIDAKTPAPEAPPELTEVKLDLGAGKGPAPAAAPPDVKVIGPDGKPVGPAPPPDAPVVPAGDGGAGKPAEPSAGGAKPPEAGTGGAKPETTGTGGDSGGTHAGRGGGRGSRDGAPVDEGRPPEDPGAKPPEADGAKPDQAKPPEDGGKTETGKSGDAPKPDAPPDAGKAPADDGAKPGERMDVFKEQENVDAQAKATLEEAGLKDVTIEHDGSEVTIRGTRADGREITIHFDNAKPLPEGLIAKALERAKGAAKEGVKTATDPTHVASALDAAIQMEVIWGGIETAMYSVDGTAALDLLEAMAKVWRACAQAHSQHQDWTYVSGEMVQWFETMHKMFGISMDAFGQMAFLTYISRNIFAVTGAEAVFNAGDAAKFNRMATFLERALAKARKEHKEWTGNPDAVPDLSGFEAFPWFFRIPGNIFVRGWKWLFAKPEKPKPKAQPTATPTEKAEPQPAPVDKFKEAQDRVDALRAKSQAEEAEMMKAIRGLDDQISETIRKITLARAAGQTGTGDDVSQLQRQLIRLFEQRDNELDFWKRHGHEPPPGFTWGGREEPTTTGEPSVKVLEQQIDDLEKRIAFVKDWMKNNKEWGITGDPEGSMKAVLMRWEGQLERLKQDLNFKLHGAAGAATPTGEQPAKPNQPALKRTDQPPPKDDVHHHAKPTATGTPQPAGAGVGAAPPPPPAPADAGKSPQSRRSPKARSRRETGGHRRRSADRDREAESRVGAEPARPAGSRNLGR